MNLKTSHPKNALFYRWICYLNREFTVLIKIYFGQFFCMVKLFSDEDILKFYFLLFILSGLRIYFYLVMIQPCYDGSFLICFISFPLFFCFLIWFWIYSLRPHQVLIQGCTFLQPVVIINNRYFFFFDCFSFCGPWN